jgi:hypothetical protein
MHGGWVRSGAGKWFASRLRQLEERILLLERQNIDLQKTGMRIVEKEPGAADGKMGPGEQPRGTMIGRGSLGFALRNKAAG